jgi:serine/threonine protein kinase
MIWSVEATEGLSYWHRHGVVHYDLRPDNFLIGDDHKLFIIDFGGSRLKGDKAPVVEADGYFMPRGPESRPT